MIAGDPGAPGIAYLPPGVSVDESVASHLGGLSPTEVFRYGADCEEHRCAHFDGDRCSLAKRIVTQLPEVVQILPRCQIRATCRWFAEEGGAACRRCPQIVTMIPKSDNAINRVATPRDVLPTCTQAVGDPS